MQHVRHCRQLLGTGKPRVVKKTLRAQWEMTQPMKWLYTALQPWPPHADTVDGNFSFCKLQINLLLLSLCYFLFIPPNSTTGLILNHIHCARCHTLSSRQIICSQKVFPCASNNHNSICQRLILQVPFHFLRGDEVRALLSLLKHLLSHFSCWTFLLSLSLYFFFYPWSSDFLILWFFFFFISSFYNLSIRL